MTTLIVGFILRAVCSPLNLFDNIFNLRKTSKKVSGIVLTIYLRPTLPNSNNDTYKVQMMIVTFVLLFSLCRNNVSEVKTEWKAPYIFYYRSTDAGKIFWN